MATLSTSGPMGVYAHVSSLKLKPRLHDRRLQPSRLKPLLSMPRESPLFRCLELSSQQHARHVASRPRSGPRIAGVRILLFSGHSFPFSYVLCLPFHLGTPAVPL